MLHRYINCLKEYLSLPIHLTLRLNQYFDTHKNELPANGLYDRIVHEVERPLIIKTLNLVKGNQLKAAELKILKVTNKETFEVEELKKEDEK